MMWVMHVILALLLNKAALPYAICTACIVAPIYALLLKPLLRSTRQPPSLPTIPHVAAPAHTVARQESPVRLSTASSHHFLSPASAGATPLQVTPVFNSPPRAAAAAASTSPARASTSSAESASAAAAAPVLEVVGTALPLPAAAPHFPTRRLVSALRCAVLQRGAAVLSRDGDDDDAAALSAAVESGEVYVHRTAPQLPRQDYLALRLLRRQQQHALYDERNITEASLNALYASPKFQAWYGANRDELLRDAQLRESFYQWRSLARAAVLLMALVLLPAYSFSAKTDAVQWRTSLSPASDAATVASAPFAQILLTRMRYIHGERSAAAVAARLVPFASYLRADVRTLATTAVGMAEWLAIATAVCSLVTSCFMPRGSRRTASIALAAFVVVLLESVLVSGVSVAPGLGLLLIATVVGTQIRRAAE